MKKWLALLLIALPLQVSALEVPVAPTHFVADNAGILSSVAEADLISTLTAIKEETDAEIGILTITSLEGEAIDQYSNKVFREWGIGEEDKNNGVLVVVSVEDRKMRIEVGYGLEGSITDAESSYIINNQMAPAFKEGNYEKGIKDAVTRLNQLINFEVDNYGADTVNEGSSETGSALMISVSAIFFAFVLLTMALSSLKKKAQKKWKKKPAMLIVGVLILILIGSYSWVVWAIGLVLSYLLNRAISRMDFAKIAKNNKSRKGGRGGFGRGFGGGMSGGGFGGGSSGGGGASGRW
jgi:uncharacterized protein